MDSAPKRPSAPANNSVTVSVGTRYLRHVRVTSVARSLISARDKGRSDSRSNGIALTGHPAMWAGGWWARVVGWGQGPAPDLGTARPRPRDHARRRSPSRPRG